MIDIVSADTVRRLAPTWVTTDKLRSCGVVFKEIGLSADHEQAVYQNSRIEVSHQPLRPRERKMQRFKSPGSTQRFVSLHAVPYNTFKVLRHLISHRTLRAVQEQARADWNAATAAT